MSNEKGKTLLFKETRADGTEWNRGVFVPSGKGVSVYLPAQSSPFKRAWMIQLMQRGHKCQLPRGFTKNRRPGYVGG